MFFKIKVYQKYELIAEQEFPEGITTLPIPNQFIHIKGMQHNLKVDTISLIYDEKTIIIRVWS